MTLLAIELSVASISRNPRRFWTQAMVTVVVVLASCGALATTRNATLDLTRTVTDSGALLYSVEATNPVTGQPSHFGLEIVSLISSADDVDYVTASVAVNHSLHNETGVQPDDSVGILAVSSDFIASTTHVVIAGSPRFHPIVAEVRQQAVVGHIAAHKLGLTSECVSTQQCTVKIGPVSYRIGTVVDFDSPGLDNSILIPLAEAIDFGLSEGPTTISASSLGLPTSRVARSLDLIASTSGKTVFVHEPEAAGELRSGIAENWSGTVIAIAVVLVLLGTAAQVAIQAAAVRFRRSEIAILRSLGCTASAISIQFTIEPAAVAAAGGAIGLGVSATIVRIAQRLDLDVSLPYSDATVLALATVITTTAASYLVSRSATKIPPSEALGQ